MGRERAGFRAILLTATAGGPAGRHRGRSHREVPVFKLQVQDDESDARVWHDVKGADGTVANWGFSGAPPGMLTRRGITKDKLKIGDVIKVEGFQAKDGSHNGSGGRVTFADGRSVFTAGAEDVAPGEKK